MRKTMSLRLRYAGGGEIDETLVYEGETWEEIARDIDRDNSALLAAMSESEDKQGQVLVFGGFIFRTSGLIAAQLSEGVI